MPLFPLQRQDSDSDSEAVEEAIITQAQIEYQHRQPQRHRPMTAKRRAPGGLNDMGRIAEYEDQLRRREAENGSGESETDPGPGTRGESRASGRESAPPPSQGSGRTPGSSRTLEGEDVEEEEEERREEAM